MQKHVLKEVQKLRRKSMKLNDIVFECKDCSVHFTPETERAKELMKIHRVINICKSCEVDYREKSLIMEEQ